MIEITFKTENPDCVAKLTECYAKFNGISQAPVQQAPVQQAPVQQAPVQQAPVQQAPVQQAPVQQAPVQQAPVQQAPVQQAPVQQAPVQQAPVSAEELQNAMQEVTIRLGDNGTACFGIINQLGVQGITEMNDTQRAKAMEQVRAL